MVNELQKISDTLALNEVYIGKANVDKVRKARVFKYLYYPKLVLFINGLFQLFNLIFFL